MNIITNKNKMYLPILITGFIFTCLLVLSPHFLTRYEINQQGYDLIYTPNHYNHTTTRYDDISKLKTPFNIIRNKSILGNIASADHPDSMHVNIIQESIMTLIYTVVIFVTNSLDSPYYFMGLLLGLSFLVAVKLLEKWHVDWPIGVCISIIMIFGYQWLFFQKWSWDFFIDPLGMLREIHLWVQTHSLYQYNSFYRIFALGGSYFIFLLFIYYLNNSLENSNISKKNSIILTLLLVAQFYTYLFYSIAASAIFIFFWLYCCYRYFLKKDAYYKQYAMRFFIFGLIALLLSCPSIYYTLQLLIDPDAADWTRRISSPDTNFKLFKANKELAVLSILFIVTGPSKGFKIISLSLIAIVLLIENLHIITGFNVEPGHIYSRTAMPLFVLMTGACFVNLANIIQDKIYHITNIRNLQYLTVFPIILVATIFFSYEAINYSRTYSTKTAAYNGVTLEQIKVFDWFNDNAKGSVVATLSPEISTPLNIFSPVTLFLNYSGMLYTKVSNEEIYERLGIVFWLLGADYKYIKYYFSIKGSQTERRYLFFYFMRYFAYSYSKITEQDELNRALLKIFKYTNLLRKNMPSIECHKLPDYVIASGRGDKAKKLPDKPVTFLKLTTTIGVYRIYKLNKHRGINISQHSIKCQ